MTVLHTGWTRKFENGWASIFGGKKPAAKKAKPVAKTAASKKKTAKKKAAPKKASKGKK